MIPNHLNLIIPNQMPIVAGHSVDYIIPTPIAERSIADGWLPNTALRYFQPMVSHRFTKQFTTILETAGILVLQTGADAMLVLLDGPLDWQKLRHTIPASIESVIVAADSLEDLNGAEAAGLLPLPLYKEKSPLLERLQHALLEAVADGFLPSDGDVIAVYSGFEYQKLDSISHIRLDDRLRRLTARDLQRLESSVPLKSLKTVIDLAAQIGREGREGKKVGALFIIGDIRQILKHCKDSGFDPLKGYKREMRNLHDARVREDLKEIAQMDGAFVISPEGIVEKSRQIIEVKHSNLTLSKGLGARHWAAAAISQITKAIAIVVSQSTGTVRLFQNGETVLRIEPMDNNVKWQEFNYEPPTSDQQDD
jgi:diadenylate cyclase